MTQIDYFLAVQSPFVYLAGKRPAEIAAKHGVKLVYRPIDPMQLFPRTGGLPPAERHPARRAYAAQDRVRVARKLGLPFNPQPLFAMANGAPASFAVIAAQQAGGGDIDALVQAFAAARWAEDRDTSDEDVIRAILAKCGFDPALADRGMLMAAEAYGRNLEDAVAAGVFGVPSFIVGEQMFWGQDRLDDLDLHLAGKL